MQFCCQTAPDLGNVGLTRVVKVARQIAKLDALCQSRTSCMRSQTQLEYEWHKQLPKRVVVLMANGTLDYLFHRWLGQFLQARDLEEPDWRTLYAYRITSDEMLSLEALLKQYAESVRRTCDNRGVCPLRL